MKTYVKYLLLVIVTFLLPTKSCFSTDFKNYISTEKNSKNQFAIAESGKVTPILFSNDDYSSIALVIKHLQSDIKNVTGTEPLLYKDQVTGNTSSVIIIGTLEKSPLINELVRNNKIDPSELSGKWEKYVSQIVENPFPGVDKALVITGSDMRGTIYGIYNLSSQIGISPWQWWSGIPAKIQANLYVNSGTYTQGEPKVKYRGFYLNLKRLPSSKNNSQVSYSFQEKAIELILRMKGNYLLPENLGESSLNDNSQIAFLAKKYGVYIKNTSDYIPLTKFDSHNKNINVLDLKNSIDPDNNQNIASGPNAGNRTLITSDKNTDDYFWNNNNPGIHYIKDKGSLNKIKSNTNNDNYGIYYNYDNSSSDLKWYNSTQIEKVWQELNTAYNNGFDKLWVVNVGSIKHMELPIEFFLDFSWNPEVWTVDKLDSYYRSWAKESFGDEHEAEIASILKKYTKYNSRLNLSNETNSPYSLTNYNEAEIIVREYNELAKEAVDLYNKMNPEYKNAFYQIVVFPVIASANLNELLVTIQKNKLYKKQNRATTNDLARRILELSLKDIKIREDYNRVLSSSNLSFYIKKAFLTKKDDQVKNYEINKPERINIPFEGKMGIVVEGSEDAYFNNTNRAELPVFDPFNNQTYIIDIFNTGEKNLNFKAKTNSNWLEIDVTNGAINKESKVSIHVNWKKAPKGNEEGSITFSSETNEVTVYVRINNPGYIVPDNYSSYVESNGYISIKPENFSTSVAQSSYKWVSIPNVGRSLSGIMAAAINNSVKNNGKIEGSKLQYNIHMFTEGAFKVHTIVSPGFSYNQDLKFAISIDNEKPQIININDESYAGKCKNISISENNGVKVLTTEHYIENQGEHTLTLWLVDTGVVFQKVVIETDILKPSYFGPPQSFNKVNKTSVAYNK